MRGVRTVEIPTFADERGKLSVADFYQGGPFVVKRIFWIYGVPENKGRASHAHLTQTQLIIPVAGSFTVSLDDAKTKETYLMDNPSQGLLTPPGIWISLDKFSPDAVCLVMAPEAFDDSEYIRSYDDFVARKKLNSL